MKCAALVLFLVSLGDNNLEAWPRDGVFDGQGVVGHLEFGAERTNEVTLCYQ